MDIKKIALLFAFAFVTTGIVYYQSWHTRQKGSNQPATAVVSPPKVSPLPVPTVVPPLQVAINTVTPQASAPEVAPQVVQNGPGGWARNPFLTPEEWAKLHEPQKPAAVVKPVEVIEELPRYVVSGVNRDQSGRWYAIIDHDRTIHIGDRLGVETVKEIRGDSRSIILENAGKTRELSLPNG